MRIRRRLLLAAIATLLALGLLTGFAFLPAVANHFGYALPLQNGLPCTLHYFGRDYGDDWQCAGYNRTAWMNWYSARHKMPSGGSCWPLAEFRHYHYVPLKQIGTIYTLFGRSHAVFTTGVNGQFTTLTPTIIFVQDGSCYRPYGLSGGP